MPMCCAAREIPAWARSGRLPVTAAAPVALSVRTEVATATFVPEGSRHRPSSTRSCPLAHGDGGARCRRRLGRRRYWSIGGVRINVAGVERRRETEISDGGRGVAQVTERKRQAPQGTVLDHPHCRRPFADDPPRPRQREGRPRSAARQRRPAGARGTRRSAFAASLSRFAAASLAGSFGAATAWASVSFGTRSAERASAGRWTPVDERSYRRTHGTSARALRISTAIGLPRATPVTAMSSASRGSRPAMY